MRVNTLDELMEYVRNRAMKAIARLEVEPGCLAYQLAEMEKRGEPEDEYERFLKLWNCAKVLTALLTFVNQRPSYPQ